MSRYFFSGTSLAGLEKSMTLPPNFVPRGGGRRTGYRYGAADCDCRYCVKHSAEKENLCTGASECICFEERLDAGCWSPAEMVRSFVAEVGNRRLTNRVLNVFVDKDSGIFINEAHQQRVKTAAGYMGSKSITAAIFLLSADTALWDKSQKAFGRNRLDFRKIDLRGAVPNSYLLFQTAKDLCHGTNRVTIGERLLEFFITQSKILHSICYLPLLNI